MKNKTVYHIHAYDNGCYYNTEWEQHIECTKDYYCKNRILLAILTIYCRIFYDNVVVYIEQ